MQVEHVTEAADVFTANVFLVPGEETTLVDVGSWDGVVDAVRDHVDDVDRVVLTHQHGDHVASMDAVVDAFAPDVYAFAEHEHRTHELADGDTVRIGDHEYDVVHTPGHADDHVSFVSGDAGALFSGDVVVYEDDAFSGGSFGRTDMAGQSRDVEIDSIQTLLSRMPDDIDAMYSGHGPVFEGDVRKIVETALARAERREPKYD